MIDQPGYIYLMRLEEQPDPWQCAHKIGMSVSPEIRATQIGLILPYPLTLLHMFRVRMMHCTERELHISLAEYRLAGEWFRPIPQWVNWFRTLSQYFIDEGEYPSHEPYVFGRSNDHY